MQIHFCDWPMTLKSTYTCTFLAPRDVKLKLTFSNHGALSHTAAFLQIFYRYLEENLRIGKQNWFRQIEMQINSAEIVLEDLCQVHLDLLDRILGRDVLLGIAAR